ncbi:MAG: SprT family zinc-dependent metalloprotease [Gammaproteobacteria bacterium]|nr:SprT family zinc-dependent metalloprotease [Gammaproteobacteria bacterium]
MSDVDVGGEYDWPPTYTLKKCPRTKHIKFKASVKHGLELVVPIRFNQKNLPNILEINKEWIKKQLAKIQSQLALIGEKKLPEKIELPCLNKIWQIQYLKTHHKKCKLVLNPAGDIIIYGEITDEKCFQLLNTWIRHEAKKILTPLLNTASQQTHLSFNQLVIRSQQTRWGSCSTAKNINLNYKLIFLPLELIQHILIHELCHTKVMNHSEKFWHLVSCHDPLWKEHNREIRSAQKFIPNWVE